MSTPPRFALLSLLPLLLVARPAGADSSAAAEAMFRQGVEALEAGRYQEACPALAESMRLEPKLGTLYTLADCEALRGRVATATAHFSDYLRQTDELPAAQASKHAGRRQLATRRMAEMRDKVPYLRLRAPAGGPFEILLDDTRVGGPMIGASLPTDPGPHRWRVRDARGAESSGQFELSPGQKLDLDLTAPVAAPVASASAAPPPSTPPAPPPPATTSLTGGRRTAFYAAAGVGAVGLGVGAVAGLIAMSRKGTVDQECSGGLCSSRGLDAVDSTRSAALTSNVGLAVGAVGLTAAAVLWFTAPRGAPSASTAVVWAPGGGLVTWQRPW